MLELGEDLLNGIEVWTVRRQEDEMRAGSPDCTSDSLPLVAAEIVEDDDVAFGKCWHKDFPDIDVKELAIDRPVDNPGRVDTVAAQGRDEGQGFPVAVRD